jgi:hypothetical protein
LRIFRIEKRVEKKNAEEERQLKNILTSIKNKSTEENTLNSLSNQDKINTNFRSLEKTVNELKVTVKSCCECLIQNQNMINIIYAYLFFDTNSYRDNKSYM